MNQNNYICNPINIDYRYQFNKCPQTGEIQINREAADPTMILFEGKYYMFVSMNLSVWVSEDLANWESHRLPNNFPSYGYAPDAVVIGEYVYMSANNNDEICNFYRTKDILNGPYEEIQGALNFADPNLFLDDDGRTYLYWGLSSEEPIYGIEIDSKTMLPIGDKKGLINGNPFKIGYERYGDDNTLLPRSDEEVDSYLHEVMGGQLPDDPVMLSIVKAYVRNSPFLEGAWMNKYQGKYYLQYSSPATQLNVYNDGVYVSDSPLGPFELAKNNPYSYKPSGFINGAGHGSTTWDSDGKLWHSATMRIGMNHQFERRVGIWSAGFDADEELFCNQRYGDWPISVDALRNDPWRNPDYFLLSYKKHVKASSFVIGKEPTEVANEDIRTWWQAKNNQSGEWIEMDLGEKYSVNAIQINFADDKIDIPLPAPINEKYGRYIEERDFVTRWTLEGSLDSKEYFMIEDKSNANTDLPHDLVVKECGIEARYIKLTILEIPYSLQPCISGLRVFGNGQGKKPIMPEFVATRTNPLDMDLAIKESNAVGYNILWGHEKEKLYHSYMTFENKQRIGALIKNQKYFVRVDAFNENGITEGKVVELGCLTF